jgi:hypothetical protein
MYCLLSDSLNISENILSNDNMNNNIGKDVKENDHGLYEVLCRSLSGGTEEKKKLILAGVPAEIRVCHLWNTCQKHHLCGHSNRAWKAEGLPLLTSYARTISGIIHNSEVLLIILSSELQQSLMCGYRS